MADFYLAPGGPLDALLTRLGLVEPRTRAVTRKRAILLAVICWGPLFILSIIQEHAFRGGRLPFFLNYPEHVRFLVAMPLLIMAESFVNRWTGTVVAHFTESGIVTPEERPRFDLALRATAAARDSRFAELLLVVVAYVLSFTTREVVQYGMLRDWLYVPGTERTRFSLAGYWFFWVGAPLYFFLIVRWLSRFLVWSLLLYRISKMKLKLIPTHPDHVGGLEFVARGQLAFTLIVLGAACVTATTLVQRLDIRGEFQVPTLHLVALFIVIACAVFLGPLLVFTPQLYVARRAGLLSYGLFAYEYVHRFDVKWIRQRAETMDPLLGSQDIQALSDLGQSFESLQKMRIFLFDREIVLTFVLASGVPFIPALLHEVPVTELMQSLLGLFMGKA